MAHLSRLAGRPAEPDPMGGYRIPLGRGVVRILPHTAAAALFPGATGTGSLFGLTITIDAPRNAGAGLTDEPNPAPASLAVEAGGVAIRFINTSA
jgi:hypothetical protein